MPAIQTTAALDANAASSTTGLFIGGSTLVGFMISDDTGTHSTHVITLQVSQDGTTWSSTSTTVTGEGAASAAVAFDWIRLLVTTLEGGASTVDIEIIAP